MNAEGDFGEFTSLMKKIVSVPVKKEKKAKPSSSRVPGA
jgi:hypothetical protein